MTDKYNRDALPHAFEPYSEEASSTTREDFQSKRPYPFLIYARSKLWDPTLVLAHSGGKAGETQMVSYDIVSGGVTFLHPIRKRQSDPDDRSIVFGRATKNDVIIPVPSVSGSHGHFDPPDQSESVVADHRSGLEQWDLAQ